MIAVDAGWPNALAFAMAVITPSKKLASDRSGGLRTILNAVPVEIMSFDADQRLVEFNSAVQEANPWADVSTWVGKTFKEILSESVAHFRAGDPHRDWNAWMEARFEQFRTSTTKDVQRPHGDWRRVHVVPTEVGGRLIIRLDITELKEREEMLAASERRYAELVDALPDGVVSIASDGCIEYASRVALDVLGRSASDTIGKRLLSLVSETDAPRLGEMLESVRTSGSLSETLICEVPRGGELRLMQFTLKRSGGAAAAIGGLIRDVHEQQAMARKSDAEMEQLTSIFQSTGAYFLMLDRDERIVMINQALRDMRGYGDRELAGTPYRDLGQAAGLTREVVEAWQAALGPAAPGADRVREQDRRRRGPGAHPQDHRDAGSGQGRAPSLHRAGRHRRYATPPGRDPPVRCLAAGQSRRDGVGHRPRDQPAAGRHPARRRRAPRGARGAGGRERSRRACAPSCCRSSSASRPRPSAPRASSASLRTVARKPTNDAQPFDLSDCARVGDDLLREQLRAARVLLEVDLPEGPGPHVSGEASRLQQVDHQPRPQRPRRHRRSRDSADGRTARACHRARAAGPGRPSRHSRRRG